MVEAILSKHTRIRKLYKGKSRTEYINAMEGLFEEYDYKTIANLKLLVNKCNNVIEDDALDLRYSRQIPFAHYFLGALIAFATNQILGRYLYFSLYNIYTALFSFLITFLFVSAILIFVHNFHNIKLLLPLIFKGSKYHHLIEDLEYVIMRKENEKILPLGNLKANESFEEAVAAGF